MSFYYTIGVEHNQQARSGQARGGWGPWPRRPLTGSSAPSRFRSPAHQVTYYFISLHHFILLHHLQVILLHNVILLHHSHVILPHNLRVLGPRCPLTGCPTPSRFHEKGASGAEKGAPSVKKRRERGVKCRERGAECREVAGRPKPKRRFWRVKRNTPLRAVRLRGTPTLVRECAVPGPFLRG